MATIAEEISGISEESETTYISYEDLPDIEAGVWPPEEQEGTRCFVCGEIIKNQDHSGEQLSQDHEIIVFIQGTNGDAFLPFALEAHGDCLPELQEKLREKNKHWRWM